MWDMINLNVNIRLKFIFKNNSVVSLVVLTYWIIKKFQVKFVLINNAFDFVSLRIWCGFKLDI